MFQVRDIQLVLAREEYIVVLLKGKMFGCLNFTALKT